ncbi:hypothetical protein EDC04DRAFT_1070382 [Pisolithus marmoratus]|nr:hypothetical protein EDC04DRAFT_1070382 [Pisolithus marmoratus]
MQFKVPLHGCAPLASHSLRHLGWSPRSSEEIGGARSPEDKKATNHHCFPQPSYSTTMSNMVNRLPYGRYYITSLEDNRNLGVSRFVNPIYPPPPVPVVVLPRDVMPPMFTVVPVEGGDNTYVVLVERRLVRGDKDRVLAYENEPAEVWVINYREAQSAYT